MKTITNFILIDDEAVSNFVSVTSIQQVNEDAAIRSFTDPEKALEFIGSFEHQNNELVGTVIYLDVNMPSMTAWEFMRRYQKFGVKVKDQMKVYVLSSSLNVRDKIRSLVYNDVLDFFEKPLSRKMVIASTMITNATGKNQ
jgi:two-component SAPR family response regulator